MSSKPFFDTDLLVYAVVDGDPRADVSRALLAGGGILSVHVLNEFVAVARRRLKMSWNEIFQSLEDFRVLCDEPVPLTIQIHEAALEIADRYGYTIYDSLVIAAALEAGCHTLYSEDMHSGHKIQRLTIRNPFQGALSS